MIPPLATSTVDSNPLFAKLWKHVTTVLLDGDASRKSENEARSRPLLSTEGSTTLESDSYEVARERESNPSTRKKTTFEQQLREVRIRSMKLEILRSTLQDLAYHTMEVKPKDSETRIPLSSRLRPTILDEKNMNELTSDPAPLASLRKAVDQDQNQQIQISSDTRDLLALITAYLSLNNGQNATNQLNPEDQELLADEIASFKACLPTISSAVGTRLVEIESSLAGLASLAAVEAHPPAPAPHPTCSQDSSLIAALTPQTAHLAHLRGTALPSSLATLTKDLHTTLRSQAQDLQTSLLQLESTKHGVQSRHAQSRAAFLATVAAAMDLKAQVLLLEKQLVLDATGQETREWVQAKLDAMADEQSQLEARIDQLGGVLAEYHAAEPELRAMKALGLRYADVEAEIDRVKRDIDRLESEGREGRNGR